MPDAWPEALQSLSDAVGVAGAAYIAFNKITGRVDWACFSGLSGAGSILNIATEPLRVGAIAHGKPGDPARRRI